MNPVLWLILTAIDIYMFFVIAGVILSWLVAFEVVNTRNRFVFMISDFLFRVTEPALRPIRRFMPHLGGIDLSPLVLIVLLYFAKLSVIWVYVRLP
ncbi:MAG: YggT family protein [Rhodospirillales bacterium]|nr:MAG: YggT family protein [Rhodospirillales bacterium]